LSDRPAAGAWFAGGLKFQCTRCGACCRGEPGYVWVARRDIRAIARFLHLSRDEFRQQYVREALGDLSLVELPDGDCIFWSSDGCRIYPVRPVQCRTFPFWNEYVQSPRGWAHAGTRCPGVDSGRLYTAEEIAHLADETERR